LSVWRALASLALLLLTQGVNAQDDDAEFPLGFFWHCPATMEGADGRFSGSLDVDEDGTRHLNTIDWRDSQPLRGVEWRGAGTLRLNASWGRFFSGTQAFEQGNLWLIFEAEKKLPKFGYFDFGEGPSQGTFVASYLRHDPNRNSATAGIVLGNLKRWAAGREQLRWRLLGADDGVRSGRWVTDGVLSTAFLSRLEVDLERFRTELLDKGARAQAECEKTAYEPELIVI
jgi:hypothetical protein